MEIHINKNCAKKNEEKGRRQFDKKTQNGFLNKMMLSKTLTLEIFIH